MTLSGVETLLLSAFLLLLMLGMSVTLSREDFATALKRRAPVLIGLASQFGWMPLIAFGLAHALALPPLAAVGLIVMGCSSGGTTSNFFTDLLGADLALSISMTVASTIVAVVAIPLLLWVYAPGYIGAAGDANLAIPYANIVATLVGVLVSVSPETGIQNAPLALGIVRLSFEPSVQLEVLPAPMLYGVIVVPFSAPGRMDLPPHPAVAVRGILAPPRRCPHAPL